MIIWLLFTLEFLPDHPETPTKISPLTTPSSCGAYFDRSSTFRNRGPVPYWFPSFDQAQCWCLFIYL